MEKGIADMDWHRAERIYVPDKDTGRVVATFIPCYRVQVTGKDANAQYIAKHAQEVLDDLQSHVNGAVHDLSHEDEPLTVTISGGGFSPVTLTVQRWYMDRKDWKKLPRFKKR